MIPVQPQPEPGAFDSTVRQPGNAFLATASQPINWKNREYWRRALPALRQVYGGYCAYLAMRIPLSVGNPTVDHFLPRSSFPHLAYEWSNFRLAASIINTSKKDALDLVDPFTLPVGWFVLDIPTMLTRPASHLPEADRVRVERTIEVLRLNRQEIRQYRSANVIYLAQGWITFEFLTEEQPFLAQELRRQSLDDVAKLRMMFEIV